MNTYGLIFDVDGVIADTEGANVRTTVRMFADLFDLHDLKQEDFDAGLGRGSETYVEAGARAHGLELTPEQLATAVATRHEYFMAMMKQEPIGTFPGVLDLINAAMLADNWRLAIATSSERDKSEAVLKSLGIPYTEMVYITGSEVRNKKPDPELFKIAVERIGVPTANCVVIEDAPGGVIAAHAAGCRCIAVTNSATAAQLAAADLVVESLAAIDLEDVRKLAESS